MSNEYLKLSNEMKEVRMLSSAMGVLGWDAKTYMPSAGIKQRGSQLSILSKIAHGKFIDPKIGKLINNCIEKSDINEFQRRNLQLWKKDYDKSTKLPTEFVAKFTKQSTITENIWEEAKRKSDFSIVKPHLSELFELTKQKAGYLDPDKDPYDVLVDIYEPNITAAEITSYFNPLKEAVLKLMNKCSDQCRKENNSENLGLKIQSTIDQQRELSNLIINLIGLDRKRFRIDESEHPFTTGTADDVRITTHYLDNDPIASVYSVFHEVGHALYELNLPQEHKWTAVGSSISLGIHESQSRFTENLIGKNPEFLKYFFPKIQEIIPGYNKVKLEDFVKSVNSIVPSKIRIYADEVTYNLHIIMRFEIERDLFSGKLSIDELPEVWNEKMKSYLGQEIQSEAEGVLQDTHWYGGAFGYFPDYALGNIYNGQFLNSMAKNIPDWEKQISEGKFSEIRSWLINNIHQKGSLYDPADLVKTVCGEQPNPKYFISYMESKFSKIYEF
jgi:carboxypeptidase Taq